MNVVAINGSPRARSSSTCRILLPLLEGMRAAGARTELIHLGELEIEPCIGCFHCWLQTPGSCIYDDGMVSALAIYREADLVVYGTPLYHGSMSGLLKNFLDRLLPRYEPWLIPSPNVEGMTGHPARWEGPPRRPLSPAARARPDPSWHLHAGSGPLRRSAVHREFARRPEIC